MRYCNAPSRIFTDETPDVVNDYGIYLAGAGLGAVGISYLLGGLRKDGGMNLNNGFFPLQTCDSASACYFRPLISGNQK
jgi:hypothetical protein